MTTNRAGSPQLHHERQTALVEAIARGDRNAFATLFRHFAPRLKGYLVRLGTDAGQAEELTQEAMLVVWHKAATFDPRQSSVSTWLFTIARNKRIDMLRRDKRPEIEADDPALVPATPAQADAIYQAAEAGARLARAITELPTEQRDLLTLAFYEERTHRDIAVLRGLPLGTVKSRLRLALAHLRKVIGEG
jgi:RNA polymerase sigma-70 factor (ECF subfamily)